jgi:hypothetical protein
MKNNLVEASDLVEISQLASTAFHIISVDETSKFLKTDITTGLSSDDIPARLERFGYNILTGDNGVHWYKVLWTQITAPMTVILIIGLVLSFLNKSDLFVDHCLCRPRFRRRLCFTCCYSHQYGDRVSTRIPRRTYNGSFEENGFSDCPCSQRYLNCLYHRG